jgi:hypothetical protein
MVGGKKTIVGLHPTRGLRLRLSVSHALAGVVLLLTGIGALRHEARQVLPWAEILVGGGVLTAILIDLRKPEHAADGKIRWVEVLAGSMLIVEGAHVYHPRDAFQPALFYGFAGLLSIAIGTNVVSLSGKRQMALDEEGFAIRTTPFRRLRLAWREVASYEALPGALHVTTRDGRRHAMRLSMVANRDEVARVFAEHAVRRVRGSSRKA